MCSIQCEHVWDELTTDPLLVPSQPFGTESAFAIIQKLFSTRWMPYKSLSGPPHRQVKCEVRHNSAQSNLPVACHANNANNIKPTRRSRANLANIFTTQLPSKKRLQHCFPGRYFATERCTCSFGRAQMDLEGGTWLIRG